MCIQTSSVSLSLLLKVCQTLKNRARNVRDIARDTLVKMAAALGPRYLPYIIREMKELLTRGYQVSGRNLRGLEEWWGVLEQTKGLFPPLLNFPLPFSSFLLLPLFPSYPPSFFVIPIFFPSSPIFLPSSPAFLLPFLSFFRHYRPFSRHSFPLSSFLSFARHYVPFFHHHLLFFHHHLPFFRHYLSFSRHSCPPLVIPAEAGIQGRGAPNGRKIRPADGPTPQAGCFAARRGYRTIFRRRD